MSKVDRELVLEALSALLDTPVKPFSGLKGKSDTLELNISNFLLIVLSKYLEGLSTVSDPAPAAGFNSDVRKEMFVDMDEFFAPEFDFDFTDLSDKSVCMRGDEPYMRPCGWYRIALKVLNKYPDGNSWLGTNGWRSHSVTGEWPVSYHGTTAESARKIAKTHYKAGFGDVYGRGIYSTYDIDEAFFYTGEFTSKKTGKRYQVIMQNRINPKMRKICDRKEYWLIPVPEGTSAKEEKEIVEKSIRPYGILLREAERGVREESELPLSA